LCQTTEDPETYIIFKLFNEYFVNNIFILWLKGYFRPWDLW